MPFPGFIEAVPGGVRGKTPHDRKVLADQESLCLTVNVQPENEAGQALDEIRSRQRQVVGASVVPAWFWSVIAVLMIVFSACVESRRAVLIGWGSSIYAVGLTSAVLAVALRGRAQIRPRYLGREGALTIGAFVVVLLAAALAVGF